MRLLILTLCLLYAGSDVAASTPATAPAVGDTPPALLGEDRDGHRVDLGDHRGKVVIVTFWASWCGFCLKELPALNALQAEVGEQWLKVIAVNVKDDTSDYRAMTRQMRDYVLVLTRDRNGEIADGYGVKSYPNLWMIDTQGKVASHHVGYGEDSLAQIVGQIKRLLTLEMERRRAGPGATGAAATAG